MNESEFLTWNLLIAWEQLPAQSTIGFGFASHGLKNWREIFKPINKPINCNRGITSDN